MSKDQALAIAYSIKRKAKAKRMAQSNEAKEGVLSKMLPNLKGQMVMSNAEAKTEQRPSTQELDADRKMVNKNSHMHGAEAHDSMKQDDISMQAKKGMRTTPIKHPKMAGSGAFTARLRQEIDDEDHLMTSPKRMQNEVAQKQTSGNPDMSKPHSTKKAYAEGGMINKAVSMEDAEKDQVVHPEGLEESDDQIKPSDEEIMADHMIALAEGGMAEEMNEDEQPAEEEDMEEHADLASAVMANRKRKMMAEGGQVDLEENAEEQPNMYYKRNQDAVMKEHYGEDLEHIASPEDSNEHGDDREMQAENDHDMDMISAIRRKMKIKSPIVR